MDYMGIYKITNLNNGKSYIGSGVDCRKRKSKHFSDLKYDKHFNRHLQLSFNKHGRDAFSFEIIEYIENKEALISREQYWIETLNPAYNIRKVASSNLGLKHSEDAKARIRKNGNKGRKYTGQALKNIQNAAKNRKYHQTDAMREASRRVMIEYNKSEAHRKVASRMGKINGPKNIKKAHAKRRIPEDIKQQIREDVANGMMQKDAATKYGYSKISICRIINNKRWSK